MYSYDQKNISEHLNLVNRLHTSAVAKIAVERSKGQMKKQVESRYPSNEETR